MQILTTPLQQRLDALADQLQAAEHDLAAIKAIHTKVMALQTACVHAIASLGYREKALRGIEKAKS